MSIEFLKINLYCLLRLIVFLDLIWKYKDNEVKKEKKVKVIGLVFISCFYFYFLGKGFKDVFDYKYICL